jgi:hypothetical protein
VTGKIVGPDKKPILEAEVLLDDSLRTLTDKKGYFEFDPTAQGMHDVLVRKIGYVPVRFRVAVTAGDLWEGTIPLERTAQALPQVVVLDSTKTLTNHRPGWIEGFLDRSRMGNGVFFDQVDIENAHEVTPVQLMLRIPGISSTTQHGLEILRVSRCDGPFGMNNKGVVWIDGIRSDVSTTGRLESLNDYPMSAVAAVEVYRGINEIPGQYYEPSACFVVLLWTRRR